FPAAAASRRSIRVPLRRPRPNGRGAHRAALPPPARVDPPRLHPHASPRPRPLRPPRRLDGGERQKEDLMNACPIQVGLDRDDYVRGVYESLETAVRRAADFKAEACTLSMHDACALLSLIATSEVFAWRDSARLNCL